MVLVRLSFVESELMGYRAEKEVMSQQEIQPC